ncbi:hypothetical protein NSB25_10670 [Acetatifactor muris]|uniref:Uncharacterized protein n=1 Tax=Acetatifactor muris TaxID=879566 RepID=A0A2K4ZFJ8_9FIRM|nr:hypothetical protein [Acetatifactor muris]MCR2047744.1 hypothetical protein [Acetatifactor muris]SOY29247.1 hypothetical protein AMURIS_01962 [Acetatifactor muris]
MKEIYNGYDLQTEWDDEALGFGFSVHEKNGAEVSRSVDPYFYEENALTAARAAADALPEQG